MNILNKSVKCPFCDVPNLEHIIDREGPIILLKNKFPVLQRANQTVLIETDQCESELSLYPKAHLHKLFRFAIHHWLNFNKDNHYKSVILFKNHGPFSGGSLSHPHSQITGFEEIDYRDKVTLTDFQGITIDKSGDVELTLSTHPRVGFYEYNVTMKHLSSIASFAEYTQIAVHYILNHFPFNINSYNLFFYQMDDTIYVKIVPRYVTTPLFIGYSIPQVANNLSELVSDMKRIYFK